MSPLGSSYAWDPLVPVYLLSGFLIAGLGAGTALFERFAEASRRFFLVTLFVALWMVPLGLARAATDPETVDLWLRVAYLWIPFSLPALYWMTAALSAGRQRLPAWLVFAVGAAFTMLNLAGPWLVDGLQALFVEGTLRRWGWLGLLYILFEVGTVLLTAHQMLVSRRGALSGAGRTEAALLLGLATVGGVAMLDYFLARDPFRAGLLTPTAILAGVALQTLGAIRYRTFAPSHSFATDEVLAAMSDAVLVCDGVGVIRGSNPASRVLLERREEWLHGRPIGEVLGAWGDGAWEGWHPSAGEARMEAMALRPRSGEPIDVSVSVEPIRFGGQAVGAVVVARDIRDRLETERALQAAQLRYRALYHHHPALVHEFGPDGRLVSLNPAGRRLLGLGPDEPVEETHWSDYVHPDDIAKLGPIFARVLEGYSEQYETRLRGPGGAMRDVRGVVVPVRDDESVVGIFGIGLDVTEEERVKRELEVQRRYFADLFESSPEGVVLVEAETDRVLRVNQEFCRLFGYPADETVGRNLNDLIVPSEMGREGGELNQAARTGGVVRAETVRRRRDGSTVEVSVLARRLDIPGAATQLYGIYRDISGRKETERALRQREEELRHAQKLEAVGKLAGGVAHDFNNLLTVINGHARFALENTESDGPLEADLLEIEKAGARAAELTQQLLAYSRRQVLRPQLMDANAVVRDVQGMLRRLIGEHIRVETRLAEDALQVRADRGQLEQVLVNLVVNARDAMPDGGVLTLATGRLRVDGSDDRVANWEVEPGLFARVTVADTGTGMSPETLERAFEPFFTTKAQGKGTGLGLATVFGIVKQSGGHVEVRSRVGEGTTCDVFLPVVPNAPPDRPAPEQRGGICPRGTILVVEDEAAVRKLAVRVLEREGCVVLSAADGVDALSVIEEQGEEIDLVLTDLVMPRMGGRDLAARLATLRADLPVVFMSGYDEDLAGTESGSGFLPKPFTPAALTEHVARILDPLPA